MFWVNKSDCVTKRGSFIENWVCFEWDLYRSEMGQMWLSEQAGFLELKRLESRGF